MTDLHSRLLAELMKPAGYWLGPNHGRTARKPRSVKPRLPCLTAKALEGSRRISIDIRIVCARESMSTRAGE